MTNFRTIYMTEVYSIYGDLVIRDFARNKKIAEQHVRFLKRKYPDKNLEFSTRKLSRYEHAFVDRDVVRG